MEESGGGLTTNLGLSKKPSLLLPGEKLGCGAAKEKKCREELAAEDAIAMVYAAEETSCR